jgi:hypothetical protein
LTSTEESRGRQGGDIPDHIAESVAGQNIVVDLRISELLDTAAKLFERAVGQPSAIAEESAYLAQELQKVVNRQSSWAPPRHDKRFNDPAWTENTFYKNLLQGYMAWSQSLQNFALKAGLEPKETGRARFLLSQISEALAPTNFLMSNPAALKAAIDSGGKTLLDGYQNFLKDAAERRPIPSQVDFRSFKVGENLAVTPGDVVMRHEMFELIQYAPQTEQVWQRPILFVPSIINKYYAFDLAQGRSLFEYLVKSGFTLFSMVFRNPKPEHDHWGMEAYISLHRGHGRSFPYRAGDQWRRGSSHDCCLRSRASRRQLGRVLRCARPAQHTQRGEKHLTSPLASERGEQVCQQSTISFGVDHLLAALLMIAPNPRRSNSSGGSDPSTGSSVRFAIIHRRLRRSSSHRFTTTRWIR